MIDWAVFDDHPRCLWSRVGGRPYRRESLMGLWERESLGEGRLFMKGTQRDDEHAKSF